MNQPSGLAGATLQVLSPIRVLVIDDDPDAVLVMEHILGHRGQMAVTTVTGASAALDLLAAGTYDIVVTDVHMPEMSGLELLRLLRLTAPQMPVLVVTANVGVQSALEVLGSEASAFLFKPLDPAQLLATVTELGRSRPRPPTVGAHLRRAPSG